MKRRNPLSFLLALALPCAGLAMTAAPAFAEPPPAAKATSPVTMDGRFQRYVVNPRGKVMAIAMQDGSIVHVPRHATLGAAAALKPGDALRIEGFGARTPTGTVITRALVRQNGAVIIDGTKPLGRRERRDGDGEQRAQHRQRQPLAPLTATGRVTGVVSSPRGHAHALLLDDGTTASGPGLETLGLKVGDRVSVSGKGGAYAPGKALRIETITLPSGETRTLPRPTRGHHHGKGGTPPV
ncbi:Hypothetical protein A7982_00802 [Minicystis rosea]|nr:Hypothetical protein A7982_00802 [Minicystis rosea]